MASVRVCQPSQQTWVVGLVARPFRTERFLAALTAAFFKVAGAPSRSRLQEPDMIPQQPERPGADGGLRWVSRCKRLKASPARRCGKTRDVALPQGRRFNTLSARPRDGQPAAPGGGVMASRAQAGALKVPGGQLAAGIERKAVTQRR